MAEATQQRIIDLDEAVPKSLAVRIDGRLYPIPSDIPIPDYLALSRSLSALDDAKAEDAVDLMEEVYERVMDIFRAENAEIEDLPIGPARLGKLILDIYSADAGGGGNGNRPTRAGTRSTSRQRPKRSRSRKS